MVTNPSERSQLCRNDSMNNFVCMHACRRPFHHHMLHLADPTCTQCLYCTTGGKKKGGSRLANMWSKAPAVKEKPKQATNSKAAAAAPAVDADAALRSVQQVSAVTATVPASSLLHYDSINCWYNDKPVIGCRKRAVKQQNCWSRHQCSGFWPTQWGMSQTINMLHQLANLL